MTVADAIEALRDLIAECPAAEHARIVGLAEDPPTYQRGVVYWVPTCWRCVERAIEHDMSERP